MSAATSILDWLAVKLPGYAVQFGHWDDEPGVQQRYAVLKPAGGAGAELVRRPLFTLSLIGMQGDRLVLDAAANGLVTALQTERAGLVFLQPGEPVYVPTNDGRPIFELALAAITTT